MKFHTQLTAKDIFKFSFAYTYLGLPGILPALIVLTGIYLLVTGIIRGNAPSNVLFGIVVIVLFVIVNPVMLYVKAKKQTMENPVYKVKTYYTIKEEGIFVEMGEESGLIQWNRILKITHFMGIYILYTGRKQAFVFPEEALGEKKDEIIRRMKEYIKTARVQNRETNSSNISKYTNADDVETPKDVHTKNQGKE